MPNLINLENVSKTYGLQTLLDSVSLGINSGDRVGVVGLNGGGKSTLLRILSGTDTPDSGRVSHANDLRMAMVTQDVLREVIVDDAHADLTVGQAVVGPLGLEVFEWASNPRVRAVLNGLEVAALGLDTPVRELSGGQRRRVGLAAALVQDLDLLILDEPTNHLDVEGVQWLASHVLSRSFALVVVTHDRWFLDTVATYTWEVHDGQVDVYEGGYNDWTFARAERARQADAAEQRRQNLARKELAWLRRGAPARTSKPRYRIEAAEALIADVPAMRNSVELMAFAARRQGKKVIDFEDATITTPGGDTLVHDLTWRLGPGERIGIVGVNGSGKTTLLRALAGDVELAAGRRVEGRTVRLGWLRQELDDLDPQQRLLDAVTDVASYVQFGDKELSASQLAERLGFSAKRQRTPVGDLSGGERRRLQLTRVLMAEPNVLLLDEPTNDLDIDTLQELESLLDSWAGTLVVISHDRYLIERICDSTWALFGDAALTNLPGGIEQYLEQRAAQHKASGRNDNVLDLSGSAGSEPEAGVAKTSGLSSQQERELQKEMKAIERKMAKFDGTRAEIQEKQATLGQVMSDPTLSSAKMAEAIDELRTLEQKLSDVDSEYETLELRWIELGELLEG